MRLQRNLDVPGASCDPPSFKKRWNAGMLEIVYPPPQIPASAVKPRTLVFMTSSSN
jgi:hypothetical protein